MIVQAFFCQKLLKLVDKCGRYSKQNQCYFQYTAWLKRPNFCFHVSPGSAETLARGGGITNHHLIAYSLINISAKNYQNQLMCVEVIVCYTIVVFLRHGELVVTTYVCSQTPGGPETRVTDSWLHDTDSHNILVLICFWKFGCLICMKFGHFIELFLRKITTIVSTRCHILRLNAPNSISAGAPPQTPLLELTALPQIP